jgi:radical SAM superfamily enzyme YgiQ (UPF0313 family)
MRLVLVGADFEENLGMCMIAAAAESAGHRAVVVPFQGFEERGLVALKVLAARPDVVGLAAQFQHRGMDFLGLACDLRRSGFRGHITAGGQFATMAYAPILSGRYGVDSVVLYEGENTIAELLDALAGKKSLAHVAGLALPDGQGGACRTAPRALVANLDRLPLAQRYRQHSRQLGVPFIPVSGSRGCWAACSFCSITTVLRDGRDHGVSGHRCACARPRTSGWKWPCWRKRWVAAPSSASTTRTSCCRGPRTAWRAWRPCARRSMSKAWGHPRSWASADPTR